MVDRLLRVAVVVGLGDGARRVVAQELLDRGAAAGLRRVADLLALGDRRAVDGGDELDRQVTLVADPDQLGDDRVPVQRAVPRRHAVVVGDVEVDQAITGGADRGQQVGLLDVHVERVERHAAVTADGVGQRQRLVAAVEEVGLEAVQRLQADPHADRLRVGLALLEGVDAPAPLVGGRAHRHGLADRGRHDRDDLAAEARDERQAVLDVGDARRARVRILVHEVARAHHQRHRAPALEPVVLQQPAHEVRVIALRLARDLDPVVAHAREPFDRALDRLRAHPVVHRHLDRHRSPPQRPSFPGFMMPSGSSAVFTLRNTSSAAPCCAAM